MAVVTKEEVEDTPTGTINIPPNTQVAIRELKTTRNPTPTVMITLGLELDV